MLKDDASYKFMLTINCPGFYNSPIKSTTSFFGFEIQTNAAPIASELEIIPEEGFALKTTFKLISGRTFDKVEDTPFTFEFYIKVENLKITYGKFIDHKEIGVSLPYSDDLRIFYRVCDNRDSCSIVESPAVKVFYEDFTSEEMNLRASEITYSFQRMDLANAQNQILLMAITLKNSQQSDLLEKFKAFAKDAFNREIERLSERPTEKVYLSKEDIFEFVNSTHVSLKVLEIEDNDLLKKLLDLLESTVNEKDASNVVNDFRKKRDVPNRDLSGPYMDEEKVRHYAEITLDLWETTYKSQKSDKAEIAERVVGLTSQLCRTNQIVREKFCEFLGHFFSLNNANNYLQYVSLSVNFIQQY